MIRIGMITLLLVAVGTGCTATRFTADAYAQIGQSAGQLVSAVVPEAVRVSLQPFAMQISENVDARIQKKIDEGTPLSPIDIALIILGGGLLGVTGTGAQRRLRLSRETEVRKILNGGTSDTS
uniref:Lipoprotein n=1 Tax=viral metagenome TaxID=1070528 RepID=A0A2V0RM19_9ZZZZ